MGRRTVADHRQHKLPLRVDRRLRRLTVEVSCLAGSLSRKVKMDVADWLRTLGLQQYEAIFRQNDIDAEVLPSLGADDLRELGISSLGHRKKLLAAIAGLADRSKVA